MSIDLTCKAVMSIYLNNIDTFLMCVDIVNMFTCAILGTCGIATGIGLNPNATNNTV